MADATKERIVNVSVDEPTRDALKDYCENARPRVFMTDAASIAIQEWIERQKAKGAK
jgi:hypothetical protein